MKSKEKEKNTQASHQRGVPVVRTVLDRMRDGEHFSIEERRAFDIGPWKFNRAKCLLCSHVVRSVHRHDCAMCPCGNLTVDGGSWYLKRAAKDLTAFKDLSKRYGTKKASAKHCI